MTTIKMDKKVVVIGRKGENESVQLVFDVKAWLEEYPTASIIVMCKRPVDENAYPVPPAQITIEDGELRWILSSADLQYTGNGQCELICTYDNVIAKDDIYEIKILNALDGGAEPPEPWTGWVEQVAHDAEVAEQAAQDAIAAKEEAQRIVSSYGLVSTLISGNNYKMGFEEVEDDG